MRTAEADENRDKDLEHEHNVEGLNRFVWFPTHPLAICY